MNFFFTVFVTLEYVLLTYKIFSFHLLRGFSVYKMYLTKYKLFF